MIRWIMSNCCAILLNLDPHAVHLHIYADMILAEVTVSCMNQYLVLKEESDKKVEEIGTEIDSNMDQDGKDNENENGTLT